MENPGARQDCAMKPSFNSAKQITSSPRRQSHDGIFSRYACNCSNINCQSKSHQSTNAIFSSHRCSLITIFKMHIKQLYKTLFKTLLYFYIYASKCMHSPFNINPPKLNVRKVEEIVFASAVALFKVQFSSSISPLIAKHTVSTDEVQNALLYFSLPAFKLENRNRKWQDFRRSISRILDNFQLK